MAYRHSSSVSLQQLCQAFATFISGLFLSPNKRCKAKGGLSPIQPKNLTSQYTHLSKTNPKVVSISRLPIQFVNLNSNNLTISDLFCRPALHTHCAPSSSSWQLLCVFSRFRSFLSSATKKHNHCPYLARLLVATGFG